MNFDALFDALNESNIMYHGTNQEFTRFEKRTGKVSTVFGSEDVDRAGFWFTPDMKMAATFGKNIITANLNIKRTADLTDYGFDPKIMDAWEAAGKNTRWFTAVEAWELFDGEDGETFAKFLQDTGYDSAKITEPAVDGHDGGEAFVVFDPNRIEIVEVSDE